MGSLISVLPSDEPRDLNIEEVSEEMLNGQWNFQLLNKKLPSKVVNHISTFLPLNSNTTSSDKPWWILSKSGEFTVKTVWEQLRRRREKSWFFTKLWKKRLPFKIAFCQWRIWKEKIHVDDVVSR